MYQFQRRMRRLIDMGEKEDLEREILEIERDEKQTRLEVEA